MSTLEQTDTWRAPSGFLWVYAALLVSMLISALDQTIVSTALPTIVGELGNVSLMSWVVAAYTLAATIGMPIYGKFGDMLGRKELFIGALSVFVVGSALCGLSQNVGQLIAFRALQGIGGGGLMVLSQAIIADVVPMRQRAKYLAPMGAVFGIASVLGPLIGGLLTDQAHWRWIFWINLPLGIAAIAAAVFLLHPAATRRTPSIDWLGITMMALAVTALTLFAGLGGTSYAWTSPIILGLGVLLVGAAAIFVVAESRARDPIIPVQFFSNSIFSIATVLGIFAALGMFAAISYMPTYLQMVHGLSATISGYVMLPMVIGILVTGTLAGSIISRVGRYRVFPIVGMAIIGVALLALSTVSTDQSVVLISAYLGLLGIGLGCVVQILVLIVQNATDPAEVGTATSANNFFREIGATIGIAAVGALFSNRLTTSLANLDLGSAGINIQSAESLTPAVVHALAEPMRSAVVDAYSNALMPVFTYLVPIFVAATVLALFLPERPLQDATAAAPPEKAEEAR